VGIGTPNPQRNLHLYNGPSGLLNGYGPTGGEPENKPADIYFVKIASLMR